MTIQDIVDTIIREFELNPIQPDSNNKYKFTLDGDIDIELFSPNNSISIFFGKLYPVISDDSSTYNIIKECAKIAVSVSKKKKSIVSIEENSIALHMIVKNDSINIFSEYMKNFATDMNWWKQQIEQIENQNISFSSQYGSNIVIP